MPCSTPGISFLRCGLSPVNSVFHASWNSRNRTQTDLTHVVIILRLKYIVKTFLKLQQPFSWVKKGRFWVFSFSLWWYRYLLKWQQVNESERSTPQHLVKTYIFFFIFVCMIIINLRYLWSGKNLTVSIYKGTVWDKGKAQQSGVSNSCKHRVNLVIPCPSCKAMFIFLIYIWDYLFLSCLARENGGLKLLRSYGFGEF